MTKQKEKTSEREREREKKRIVLYVLHPMSDKHQSRSSSFHTIEKKRRGEKEKKSPIIFFFVSHRVNSNMCSVELVQCEYDLILLKVPCISRVKQRL